MLICSLHKWALRRVPTSKKILMKPPSQVTNQLIKMQTGQAASPMWLVLNIKIYLNDEKCLLPSALGAGDPHSYAFPSHSCGGFYGRIKA